MLNVRKARPGGHPNDGGLGPVGADGSRFGRCLNDHCARGLLERDRLWGQPRPVRCVHRSPDLGPRFRPFQRLDFAGREAGPTCKRSVIELPRGSERGGKPFEFFCGRFVARPAAVARRVGGIARVSHRSWSLTPPTEPNNATARSSPRKSTRQNEAAQAHGEEQRLGFGHAKVAAQRVVPVVGDLAHSLQQILEFFVVEAGQPSQCANDHFAPLSVDCEGRIRCCQE